MWRILKKRSGFASQRLFGTYSARRNVATFFAGMNRKELEHIVRAAAGITGENEFVIVGSQSILGKHPDAPRSLRHSLEVDTLHKSMHERWEIVQARNETGKGVRSE